MKRGSILSFVQRGRLAMSQSRSAAGRSASTACGSMAGEAKEAFVGDVRSMADADDLSGSDAERSKPQALAGLFPAFDRTSSAGAIASPVCEAVWFKERVASLRLARTRAFDRSQSATSQRANQPLQPTPGTGSVFNLVSPARRG